MIDTELPDQVVPLTAAEARALAVHIVAKKKRK
jgi:hypothetical protein